jgi:WD40 repeat protein
VLKERSLGVNSIAFSNDGKLLAAANKNLSVTIWDVLKAEPRLRLKHPNIVSGVAFDPNNQFLASACYDGSISLWHLPNGKRAHLFQAKRGEGLCLTLAKEGKRAVGGNMDSTIAVWDAKSGQKLGTVLGHHSAVSSVVWVAKHDLLNLFRQCDYSRTPCGLASWAKGFFPTSGKTKRTQLVSKVMAWAPVI